MFTTERRDKILKSLAKEAIGMAFKAGTKKLEVLVLPQLQRCY